MFVDGDYAGRWYHGYQNEHLRWFDSDYDIHARYTQGKDAIVLRLVVDRGAGHGAFTEYDYRIYSFVAGGE